MSSHLDGFDERKPKVDNLRVAEGIFHASLWQGLYSGIGIDESG